MTQQRRRLRIPRLFKILVISSLVGLIFAVSFTWAISLHQRIPSHWGRVYLTSDCEFSHAAFRIVKSKTNLQPVAAIPLDVGSLMLPACRHTQELLIQHNSSWNILRLIPDELICKMMIADGSKWFYSNVTEVSWPVFAGTGGVVVGTNPNAFAAVGLEVTLDEIAQSRAAPLP